MSTCVRSRRLLTLATLTLLLLALVHPVSAAGLAATPGVSTGSVAGPFDPPLAALRANGMPSSGVHALGSGHASRAPRQRHVATDLLADSGRP